MRFNACLIGLVFASSAGAQDVIRYDFAMRAGANSFSSGDISMIDAGDEGIFSITALDDRSIYSTSSQTFQRYQVLDVSIQVGSYSRGGASGVYPSTSLTTALEISNDQPTTNLPYDAFVAAIQFDDPQIGFAVFGLQEVASTSPTFLSSTDLPRALDLSLAEPNFSDLYFTGNGSISFEITDVTITVIPTPGTGALLALTGLAAMRRKR